MPIRKPKASEFTDGLAIRKPTLSLAVSDDDEDVTELTERLGSLKGVARPTLSERLGAVGKPTLSLAVSDDDDDVTELTDGVAAVSVQRQGSFSLSETMTFSSEDLKLRGARGMELSGGDSASSVMLRDLDRLKQLGAGATSRVFLARHKTTGQKLALKELTVMADRDTRHMAVNELRLAHKSSRGEHLIRFVDAFFDEGKILIAMEFADGGSMDDAIQRGQGGVTGVPEPVTGLMVLQALQGLG